MKKLKLFLISCVALLGSCTQGTKDVEINETNFPDENFRAWISEQEYGKDGVSTAEEIAEINSINVSGKNIKSLDGIRFFTALRGLNCETNQLTALDVSQNTALTYLSWSVNQLTALNVSKNTELRALDCSWNQIKGEGMDALVTSLPTTNDGQFTVITNINNEINNVLEKNEMTEAQVTAAKAKGWVPYYYDGKESLEYTGGK